MAIDRQLLRTTLCVAVFVSLSLWTGGFVNAQGERGGPTAPSTAKAASPADLTGYWVSVVTEDCRWRMVTPLKGDAASVPINDAARKIVDAWDPAKDEAAGLQCKSYGAPAIMRVPGRLHITWRDDNTLKIDTDSGMQMRLFHFTGTPPKEIRPSWQGYSAARWDAGVGPGARRSRFRRNRTSHWNAFTVPGSRHDESSPGIFAEEWRSLQRAYNCHRILRPVQRT